MLVALETILRGAIAAGGWALLVAAVPAAVEVAATISRSRPPRRAWPLLMPGGLFTIGFVATGVAHIDWRTDVGFAVMMLGVVSILVGARTLSRLRGIG